MFYLTPKFHDDSVNTFEFMGGGGDFEALPPGPGTPIKPMRNGVKFSKPAQFPGVYYGCNLTSISIIY